MRAYLWLDYKTTEFVVDEDFKKELGVRFPGTVMGAVALNQHCRDKKYDTSMSSDLNHPAEFPTFEAHAIDVAAGYFEGAIEAGLIRVEHEENEGSD